MKNKRIISVLCLLFVPLMLLLSACGSKTVSLISTTAEDIIAETLASTTTQSEIPTANTTKAATDKETATVKNGTTEKVNTATSSRSATTSAAVTAVTPKPKNTVSLKITCAEAVEYMKSHNIVGYEKIVPQNGIMLSQDNIDIQKNDTALDILKRVTKDKKLLIVVRSGYVANIGGLAAADERQHVFGTQSGWLYYVNGTAPLIGAGELAVKAGDTIEFRFVCKKVNF